MSGDIVIMDLLLDNTPILRVDSILKSGVIQSFNSIDKIMDEVKIFLHRKYIYQYQMKVYFMF